MPRQANIKLSLDITRKLSNTSNEDQTVTNKQSQMTYHLPNISVCHPTGCRTDGQQAFVDKMKISSPHVSAHKARWVHVSPVVR